MALTIGDAIHNLRVAVDYVYLGAVERHAPTVLDKHTKFPTGETRKNVEDALKNRKIDVLSPKLFDGILTNIKPYVVGGNCLVKFLHDLDIHDKHWLLTPLMRVATITDIIVEDENGSGFRCDGDQRSVLMAISYRPEMVIAMPRNDFHR